MDTYNGWKNKVTWNVALWIGNDEGYYNIAKECSNYKEFKERVGNGGTPDSVSWYHVDLDIERLDEMIIELNEVA